MGLFKKLKAKIDKAQDKHRDSPITVVDVVKSNQNDQQIIKEEKEIAEQMKQDEQFGNSLLVDKIRQMAVEPSDYGLGTGIVPPDVTGVPKKRRFLGKLRDNLKNPAFADKISNFTNKVMPTIKTSNGIDDQTKQFLIIGGVALMFFMLFMKKSK